MTSSTATGIETGIDKTRIFHEAVGSSALGLASGITSENIDDYVDLIDLCLVATGINRHDDFYKSVPTSSFGLNCLVAVLESTYRRRAKI